MKIIIDKDIINTEMIYKISELYVTLGVYGVDKANRYLTFSIYFTGTTESTNITKSLNSRSFDIDEAKRKDPKVFIAMDNARNELIKYWSEYQTKFPVIKL